MNMFIITINTNTYMSEEELTHMKTYSFTFSCEMNKDLLCNKGSNTIVSLTKKKTMEMYEHTN